MSCPWSNGSSSVAVTPVVDATLNLSSALDLLALTPSPPTHDDDVISEWWPLLVKWLQWLLCAVGILGNSSVLYVYVSKSVCTPSESFILLMALFDLGMCVLSLFFTASQQWLLPLNCFLFCASGNFCFDFINTASSVLMLIVTVNRFVAVCRPHSYKTLFSGRSTGVCVGVCVLLGVLNTPVGVLMCTHFILDTKPPPPCPCHQVIRPAPEVAVLKLVWVLLRALLMLLNAANMGYCYWHIYHRMVLQVTAAAARDGARATPRGAAGGLGGSSSGTATQVRQREAGVSSLKALKQAMEREDFPPADQKPVDLSQEHPQRGVNQGEEGENGELETDRLRGHREAEGVPEATGARARSTCHPQSAPLAPNQSHANSSGSRPGAGVRSRDQKLTTTLFVVSVAYVILVTPDLLIHLLDVFALVKESKFTNFRTLTQTLYLVNYVINPFIHLTVNSYYQQQLSRMLHCGHPA